MTYLSRFIIIILNIQMTGLALFMLQLPLECVCKFNVITQNIWLALRRLSGLLDI